MKLEQLNSHLTVRVFPINIVLGVITKVQYL